MPAIGAVAATGLGAGRTGLSAGGPNSRHTLLRANPHRNRSRFLLARRDKLKSVLAPLPAPAGAERGGGRVGGSEVPPQGKSRKPEIQAVDSSSSGQRGFTSNAYVMLAASTPACSRIAAAIAIIAPLSVHKCSSG
jgi:hypothetical protein